MATRALLLSPHPDDLAWSLGGTVARLRAAGVGLSAITFFGSTCYAPGDPSHGSGAAAAVRAAEEDAWAAWAGVRLQRYDLADASLRGYDDDTEMGAEPEPEIVRAVAERLSAALAEAETDLVLAPLAVAGHVDHSAVRRAVSATGILPHVLWYEDLPYAYGSEAAHGDHSVVVDIAGLWDVKEAGVRFFRSQLPDEVLEVLRGHALAVAGERLWADDAAAASLIGLLG